MEIKDIRDTTLRVSYRSYQNGRVNGRMCTFLLDTSSDVSLVSSKLVDRSLKRKRLHYPTEKILLSEEKVEYLVELGVFSEKLFLFLNTKNSEIGAIGNERMKQVQRGSRFKSSFAYSAGALVSDFQDCIAKEVPVKLELSLKLLGAGREVTIATSRSSQTRVGYVVGLISDFLWGENQQTDSALVDEDFAIGSKTSKYERFCRKVDKVLSVSTLELEILDEKKLSKTRLPRGVQNELKTKKPCWNEDAVNFVKNSTNRLGYSVKPNNYDRKKSLREFLAQLEVRFGENSVFVLRMNVRSVIGWDRSIVIYRLPMPVVLQPTMRKCLGGLSSEGKVKRRVLLSFIEISRLGPRIPKHEGSCGKAEEVLSMSTLEIFGRRPHLSGRQLWRRRIVLRARLEEFRDIVVNDIGLLIGKITIFADMIQKVRRLVVKIENLISTSAERILEYIHLREDSMSNNDLKCDSSED
ncbi:putative multidrug resistance-associated protein lethal(2)03659 isoform X1 [Vespula maculifrons]|uniref:Multidrug resistance-associated protein lethal(2)03659 isoform X1 n=1 Tax=Vespula maculifrons TaxID=7453 RepID=A0ABD2CVR2_VESMC